MILPRTIRLVVPGNGVDLPVLSEPEVDAGITVTRPEEELWRSLIHRPRRWVTLGKMGNMVPGDLRPGEGVDLVLIVVPYGPWTGDLDRLRRSEIAHDKALDSSLRSRSRDCGGSRRRRIGPALSAPAPVQQPSSDQSSS